MSHKEAEILSWAADRSLLNPDNIAKQFVKTAEEVGELAADIARSRCPKDSIGDVYVTLVIIANQAGLTMDECIDHVYEIISARTKGETVNGVFIKAE